MGIRKIPENTTTFTYCNRNPKNNKTNDCVIRAISLAHDISWDAAFRWLTEYAFQKKRMPNDEIIFQKFLTEYGWIKNPCPKKADNTRYTVAEFCNNIALPDTTYILRTSGHVTVVKDCKCYDTWNCTEYKVGTFWTKK